MGHFEATPRGLPAASAGATLGRVKPTTPLIVVACVAGFAVSVVGPIVGYRMMFTSSFELSCLNHGAPPQLCACASEKTLEKAELLELFDPERMGVIAQSAVAECR